MMDIEEAIKVLWENRPEKPYKTKGRRLQVAIDTVIEELSTKPTQGAWERIKIATSTYKYKCTVCGNVSCSKPRFCSNCGSKNNLQIDPKDIWCCHICGMKAYRWNYNFCPNCGQISETGAKMAVNTIADIKEAEQ